jgi:hypothetical protein
MEKLANKLTYFIILILFFSCSKKREIENIFITKKNEYWNYKDCDGGHSLYFKFNKNGSYDKYLSNPINEGKGFDLFNNDGDLLSGPRSWIIKNDSTFVWDKGVYRIEVCVKDSIVLSYNRNYENNKKCKITFRKVIDK